MRLFLFLLCFLSIPFIAHAEGRFDHLSAKQIYVKDIESGQVLYADDARASMPTSSMSKVMTMYMVFDALKRGELKLSDTYTVSEKSWKMGGSKMFIEVGEKVLIEDLIKGVTVQSGNDATVCLAEGLAGAEDVFARMMTAKAKEIGMENSNFVNASGWPDPDHYSTAEDLALLAESVIETFPEYYHYYSIPEYEYNKITQRNRNPLLFRDDINVDGMKTGHTEIGGYGLMASGLSKDKSRRVVLVMNGIESQAARATETAEVMTWALNGFENVTLRKAGAVVQNIPVVYGAQNAVPAGVDSDLIVTYPLATKEDSQVQVTLNTPLKAPIKQGDQLGVLKVVVGDDKVLTERPLRALQDVERANIFMRIIQGLSYKVFGAPDANG